jgi:hypothetical protein
MTEKGFCAPVAVAILEIPASTAHRVRRKGNGLPPVHFRPWLRQAARTAALLTHAVRLMGRPPRAGKQACQMDYAARVAAWDPTVWDELLTAAADEMEGLRLSVADHLERNMVPTRAAAGTPEKIHVMQSRVLTGQAVFHPNDGWPVTGPA